MTCSDIFFYVLFFFVSEIKNTHTFLVKRKKKRRRGHPGGVKNKKRSEDQDCKDSQIFAKNS